MSKLRVSCFSISLDGFGAGPEQDEKNPLGVGGFGLHEWMVQTRYFQTEMLGKEGGTTGIEDDLTRQGMAGVGAWILGRNMFGPVRGPWPDDSWKGWWGDEPPYHVPTFVLTKHARSPVTMKGGTTFHFVTGGIHEALERAREAAGDKDIRVGGGVATIRQYLEARLLDELHIAISPVLLGSGEHLFSGLDLPRLGYRCAKFFPTEKASHMILMRA